MCKLDCGDDVFIPILSFVISQYNVSVSTVKLFVTVPFNVKSLGIIQFVIPCQQPGLFADFSNMYFKCTMTNGHANAKSLHGSCGTIGLFKRVYVETSTNTRFDSINQWNTLGCIEMDKISDLDYKEGVGKSMFGTGRIYTGSSIAANSASTTTKVVPLMLNSLAGETYVPLAGRENIHLYFELDSCLASTISTAASAGDLTLSDCVGKY